jgi:hypothetical protein
LDDLFETYQNDLSKVLKYELNTWLLIESGKLKHAMDEIKKGIDFEERAHSGFWGLHVGQAYIHIMEGAIRDAQHCLERADGISRQIETAPFQLSAHYKTQLELDLYRFRESLNGSDRAEVDALQSKTFQSVKLLQKVARKVAYHRTDSYRLTGSYYWAVNKQKRALRWWHLAAQEGERLGARPQLARLYFEVGKCLFELKDKRMKLDGLKGEEYLEKAKGLFEEMGRVVETGGVGGK